MLPVLPLAGAEARFQPVWVEDVARAIVACLDDPSTIGMTIECAGPRVYTLAELVRAAGRWSGASAAGARPAGRARPACRRSVMELLPGTPLMSRDNLDSMRVANVASGKLPGLNGSASSRRRSRRSRRATSATSPARSASKPGGSRARRG